ncbi:hypothetical protein AGDE_00154 [Angomonas deanei]|nr:hypothetical protein AGDE_00154 [Angomonas deanei]|eukprot:EPY43767.1 hypothetical protein AGDE_00154 [Angomonas deanei]
MEKLRILLKDKVARDSKNPPVAGEDESKAKVCWLCGCQAKTRFRLKDSSALCFSCFRTAYWALVHPKINVPARQKSDAAFTKLIESIQLDETNGDVSSSLAFEVTEPSQASFFLSRSARPSTKAGYKCPRCSFQNAAPTGPCHLCGCVQGQAVFCPVCSTEVAAEYDPNTATKCTNRKRHLAWFCSHCDHGHSLDGDVCEGCGKSRSWVCSQCTALNDSTKNQEGLRYCSTCSAYNTPDDIVMGKKRLDEETYRELIRTQANKAGSEVVFGVNDTGTLEEQRRNSEIEQGKATLNARLKRLGKQITAQKQDGNCLFSALAHQLFGNSRLHRLVRSLVVAYMRENSRDYAALFENWPNYIVEMTKEGTWGDEVCVNAAARCFGVNIHLITSDKDRWHVVFQHEILGNSQTNLRNVIKTTEKENSPTYRRSPSESHPGAICLFLAYLRNVHYDDITPSPVDNIVLSDLLLPELQKMIGEEGHQQGQRGGATGTGDTVGLAPAWSGFTALPHPPTHGETQ